MVLIVMIVASVIGIPVSQELSEHLLDVIQGFLLSQKVCSYASNSQRWSSSLLSTMLAENETRPH